MKLLPFIVLLLFSGQLIAQISDFEDISFKKADSIAHSHKGEDLANLPELSYKLTSNLNTDVERFRSIYRWVCANIKNDYSSYLKNNHRRQRFKNDSLKFNAWNTKFRQQLFTKLLKKKRTICTGYAYLVKALSDLANIECDIVQGYGRVSTTNVERLTIPNHSWNVVKLNNKWYLCDPTWASGIPNPETNRFTFQYNDGFFLANPKLFAVNHFPIESKWWLLKDDLPTFDDFLNAPVLYGKAYSNLETHDAPKQMHHTLKINENIVFLYKLKTHIKKEDVELLIDNGSTRRKIKPKSVLVNNNQLTLEHQFDSSGHYDVHLYLKDELICTYVIQVNN